MAQRMFHETGQDGRSVLGMLAVQVERDPKTGAAVVRSVAPVSTPTGAPKASTVFDDGRKSIHRVGQSEGQPTTEELGRILSAIDGVGMKVLLDEVTVMPNNAETKTENRETSRTPEEKLWSFSSHLAPSGQDHSDADASKCYQSCAVSVVNQQHDEEHRSVMELRESAAKVDQMEDQQLEEGPVSLVFLGYSDATAGQGHSQDEHGGIITVQRVIITEEGEEHVLGPETAASALPASGRPAGKESQEEQFQEIPLDGNGIGAEVQGGEDGKGLQEASAASVAEGEGASRHKPCQCCSVM
ncbi:uncharacterized protein LOC113140585 [Mastacembelus armatus]|uniref:uncharacterized protein LOC113140585 n=1 Tax=Mastacembelus armatus TaxID=205130 RepID=UPI000E4557ED|nr:uncharacterized protein LOC113140585 [Mastacembelus armatus]XP_026180269.1 uncharacterized protein LOC113140585 [Mastacembelus armatus]